jgi:hypothetical protein
LEIPNKSRKEDHKHKKRCFGVLEGVRFGEAKEKP